jgi:hypothetical protein
VGTGVAKVDVVNGTPTVTERMGDNGWWWDTVNHPRYGDAVAYRDENSDYIYAIGGAPSSQSGWIDASYVYQARVLAANAFNLSSYEYWHGRATGWSTDVLTDFTSETAVMWNVGQGQIVYSQYYKCYIFVHTSMLFAISLPIGIPHTDKVKQLLVATKWL